MKVAIVHDWLVGGGAEKVTLELHRLYPEAPIYTSYCSPEWRQKLDGKVVTGYLQRWPFSKLRKFLPVLRIWWFTRLDFSAYDLVISVSGNGEAKGVRVPAGTKHINYCHTPTHFYWRHYAQYLKSPGFGVFNPLARLGLRILVGPLRKWDYKAAQRADLVLANSSHIKDDIKKYYGRDSIVVHPPVDTERFAKAKQQPRQGYVTMGRLAPYKRVDLIVEACTQLNLPLKVIGRGPELSKLRKLAGPTVSFLTDVSDEAMPGQLASAEAFIFAAFEDFGIAPVEAMATGTPVIAYKAGGAVDYVREGVSGAFFQEQTVESLAAVLEKFNPDTFDPQKVRVVAEEFSQKTFAERIQDAINQVERT